MKIEDLKLDENGNITRFCYKPEYNIKLSTLDHSIDYLNEIEIRVMHRHPDASKFKTNADIDNWNNRQVHYFNDDQPVVSRSLINKDVFKKMDEKHFWNFLFDLIKKMEIHELEEWFKIDGKYFKNPHPHKDGIPESECF